MNRFIFKSQFLKIWGYSTDDKDISLLEEMLNINVFSYLPPQDIEQLKERISLHLNSIYVKMLRGVMVFLLSKF